MQQIITGKKKYYLAGLSIWYFVSLILLAVLFLAFPYIDLKFSGLFYDPVNHFFLKKMALFKFFYESVEIITIGFTASLMVFFFLKTKPFGLTRKKIFYLLLVLILGPGLLVNVVLKNNWGRARPDHVIQFGGTNTFTPAILIARECDHNCSFTSGHAAMGFYFVAIAFLFPRLGNKYVIILSCYSLMVGLTRIVQGRHFLSDVIFSFFVVFGVARLLYYLMFEIKPRKFY